jgi:pimeloyl-ACP methyl ester carboxylesterase
MKLNGLLASIAAVLLAACGGRIEVSIPENRARLELHACEPATADEGAQCATLSVPEDRARIGGRVLRLPVLVLRAKSRDPGADPVVVLGGGPGNSVIAAFASMPAALLAEHPLRQHRDLIVMDQRGISTGAQDSLDCPELAKDYAAGERFSTVAELASAAQRCRGRLAAQGIDVARYDSASSAADLEDLRVLLGRALGFERWHVVGTSYGSRLALTYAGRHGAAVSSLVLDGPLPREVNALYDASLLEALDRAIASCAVDAACNAAKPALQSRFDAAITQLLSQPATLASGARLTGPAVLGTLRALLAAGHGDAALLTMDLVAHGRLDELDAMLGLSTWIDLVPNPSGMYTSVMCQDEAGHPTAPGRLPAQGEGWSSAVRVAAATHSNLPLSAAICPAWLSGTAPQPVPKPVYFGGPTLVTVGEWDPMTPVDSADRIRSRMPQTRVVTLARRGHGLLESDACVALVMAAFLRGPSSPIDASCAEAPAGQMP